jgi:hypothetical protein
MKKYIAIAMLGALCLTAASCLTQSTDETATPAATAEPDATAVDSTPADAQPAAAPSPSVSEERGSVMISEPAPVVSVQSANANAPASINMKDGDETGVWFSDPPSLSRVSHEVVNGDAMLAIDLVPSDGGKTIVKRNVNLNLSESSGVVFYVFNTTRRPIKASVGLSTGSTSEWFESPETVLPVNDWVRVVADANEKTWKCEASGWKSAASVKNSNETKAVCLVVNHGLLDGRLWIGHIKIKR